MWTSQSKRSLLTTTGRWRVLKVLLREGGYPDSLPITKYNTTQDGGQGYQAPNQRGGGQAGRARGQNGRGAGSGTRQKKPPALAPNGRMICFNYQKQKGCSNAGAVGGGCKDPVTGTDYAHCCAWFYPETRTYCLLPHGKCAHPG